MKFSPSINDAFNQGDVDNHFIHPGEFFFGGSDCQIHTLLGSCIAITLWHPVLHIGGMCHFVLSKKAGGKRGESQKYNGRYCDGAMAFFEREAIKYGTSLSEYQAQIFGGSNMLAKSTVSEDKQVGRTNTAAAIKHLKAHNIPLVLAHVGETGHRRIVFNVETGEVLVRHEPLQKNITG